MVAEAKLAVQLGYTSQAEGRPWRDVFDQIEPWRRRTASVLIDLIQQLVGQRGRRAFPARAGAVSQRGYRRDAHLAATAGNKQIRAQTRLPIAMHFGSPPIMTALEEDVCDGFVVGGGAARLMHEVVLSAAANKPFWLQLVGTGLTTAWTVQVGAVATHAQWPAVTCMHIWQDDLITEPIQIAGATPGCRTDPAWGSP
jgi:galactonate dehydratase